MKDEKPDIINTLLVVLFLTIIALFVAVIVL